METQGLRFKAMNPAIAKILFRLVTLVTVFLGLTGCGEDEIIINQPGNILIVQPQQGQQVTAHSVYVSVALDPTLNPAGLHMLLNGQDMTSHLRKAGWVADGYVSGMDPGTVNTLLFTAPGVQGGASSATVQFTFNPKDIESVSETGSFALDGLEGDVEVLVDPWGVHHIYTMGDNPDDLGFVQGYLTAKHRLFQLDFYRKVAEGRLAELLGTALDPSVLETDLFLRTMFLTHERGTIEMIYNVLAEEMQTLFPDKYALMSRFVEGVNAYIDDLNADRNGAEWPQQHKLLNLFYGAYTLEHMTVAQILAIGRVQQWDLSNTLYEEIDRKVQVDSLTGAQTGGLIPAGSLEDILRSEPPDHTTILKPGEPYYVGPASGAAARTALAPGAAADPAGESGSLAYLRKALKRLERVQRLVSAGPDRPFSNNWIISPAQTASGFAVLCNDPHLGLTNPSIFYPVHADNKTFSGGTLNFSGCTFPGVPGLMLGQNERVAWGGTVTNYDVTDVYEETVTVDGEGKTVTYYGEQVPVETTTQSFNIRGGAPVSIDIDFVPHHGPQLPGDPYSDNPGLTPENNLTVQWTGHYISLDVAAFLGLLEAQDIDGFIAAVENFGVGAQNFVGADVNGEIAYHPHALIPIRKPAALTHEHPPWLPLPGTGGYEWQTDEAGKPLFLPSDQIPQSRNPARGWLITANNDITGQTIDNDPLNDDSAYLTYQYDEGFRNGRVTELLTGIAPQDRDLDHMKTIQGDHRSRMAERLRPYYLAALSNSQVLAAYPQAVRERLAQAKALVESWDLRCTTGLPDPFTEEPPSAEDVASSIGSSIFFVWVNRVTEFTLDDELAAAGISLGTTDRIRSLLHILDHVNEPEGSLYQVHTVGPYGQSLLWDNINTAEKQETRDEILVAAMAQALQDLDSMMTSSDMNTWQWGKIHTLTLELEGLGGTIYAYNLPSYSICDQILGGDLKGYPRQGGWETVDPASYGLHGLDFSTGNGPAMRMMVELEDGVMRAFNILPGGVNDLQPKADPIFNPVKIDAATHYGDQLPLYLANKYRPQFIFWEDVTEVAEGRLHFGPE
jgi:penicillin G amidase